ncbi:DUF3137 domain-containing protein [Reichenbachiella ulvae]|uniref:DUF3137 domain-containing protein n=1 Tax=Reichenbachiella ulvae TaxID=2980104 RepID=A0ABT3CV91_9BACT|nr:DUF3137 domain-containing protein [Reichenbachiella ulvae]MCV9387390.1 DUF3137 domain-containing protein [Reichenbachiella ulvae]
MEQLQTVYTETREVLNTLYQKRRQTLFYQKIMWGVFGIYLVFMMLILGSGYLPDADKGFFSLLKHLRPNAMHPYINMYLLGGMLVLLYPTTLVFARAFQKFKIKEDETMARVVRRLFPMVEFTQGAKSPAKEVVRSKLFAWIKEDAPIYSYGQIRSKTNDTEVNITDLGIAENNVANKLLNTLMHIPVLNMFGVLYQNVFKNLFSGKLADNTQYSYRGMFCWLNFKKKLNGHTVVLPKNQKAKLDRWVSFNFREEQEVHLEDPRFTERFVVYGTDQVEARYVLSSSIMERVVSLNQKFDRPIMMSFENRQLYLAVENENGLFSFSSGKLEDVAVLEELANDIDTALHIPQALF